MNKRISAHLSYSIFETQHLMQYIHVWHLALLLDQFDVIYNKIRKKKYKRPKKRFGYFKNKKKTKNEVHSDSTDFTYQRNN